jgi:hypothetical protein
MKTIPDPVPNGHGTYILVHKPTKSIYIGSTTDLRGRSYEWRHDLKTPPLYFPQTDRDAWEFRVVEVVPGIDYSAAKKKEKALVETAKLKGMNVLNLRTPFPKDRYTVDGIDGSATFHATRLGHSPQKVLDKLKRGYTITQALKLEAAPFFDHRQHAINQMPIKITQGGRHITYKEAAPVLGVSPDTVRERLKKYCRQNPTSTEVTLENLLPT